MKKHFVIVDLEATCYDRNNNKEKAPTGFFNEIIEIGAIKLDSTGKEIDRFSHFCKPKTYKKLSNFCIELTTITQEDINNADDLAIILEEFMIWCKDCVIISWGNYDKTQLSKDLIRNDLEIYLDYLEDHHSLKHLHGKWNNLGKRGVGMGRALKYENIELEGTHHRGIDDAINIAKIFRKYIHKFI